MIRKIISDYKNSIEDLPPEESYGLYQDIRDAEEELSQLLAINERMMAEIEQLKAMRAIVDSEKAF
jgi:chromosome segregation ATPase